MCSSCMHLVGAPGWPAPRLRRCAHRGPPLWDHAQGSGRRRRAAPSLPHGDARGRARATSGGSARRTCRLTKDHVAPLRRAVIRAVVGVGYMASRQLRRLLFLGRSRRPELGAVCQRAAAAPSAAIAAGRAAFVSAGAAGFVTAGFVTAGFFTVGFFTAGFVTAVTGGFFTSGFFTAGFVTDGFFTAGFFTAGFVTAVTAGLDTAGGGGVCAGNGEADDEGDREAEAGEIPGEAPRPPNRPSRAAEACSEPYPRGS